MKFRILFFATLLFLAVRPALAWDSLGHMITAQIAWEELTPEAKAGVEASLARFNKAKAGDRKGEDAPYDFITAACWMDDIRSLRGQYSFGPWHYVTLPFTLEGLPVPPPEDGPNVIWGIERCADIISGKVEDPEIDRDQALVMLLHLVGDIHQPLHTTSRAGDLGGNLVLVPNMELTEEEEIFGSGKIGNLHAFWDSAYRRGFRGGKVTVLYEKSFYEAGKPSADHLKAMDTARREADILRKKHPASSEPGAFDPSAWALESHAIGYETSYGKLPEGAPSGRLVKLDEPYVTEAREIAGQRLAIAGYRMAALVNRLFAEPATESESP